MCHNETEARAEKGAVGAGGNRSGDSGWDGSRERQRSEQSPNLTVSWHTENHWFLCQEPTILGEPAILCPDQTLIGKQGNWLEVPTLQTVQ